MRSWRRYNRSKDYTSAVARVVRGVVRLGSTRARSNEWALCASPRILNADDFDAFTFALATRSTHAATWVIKEPTADGRYSQYPDALDPEPELVGAATSEHSFERRRKVTFPMIHTEDALLLLGRYTPSDFPEEYIKQYGHRIYLASDDDQVAVCVQDLRPINTMADWDTSQITNMADMFRDCGLGAPHIN